MFETLLRLYLENKINADNLAAAVLKGFITQEQMELIIVEKGEI